MQIRPALEGAVDRFSLKHQQVNLVTTPPQERRVTITVDELELIRVGTKPVPASKHELEVICGASCEVGAH